MTHEEMRELYELYALGVLEPEEKAEMEEHLARNCPVCKAGVQRGLAFGALFGGLPDSADPPKRLRRRILASVGVEAKTGYLWMGALAFLSACLLIGLVMLNRESSRRGEETERMRTALRQSTSDLSKVQTALSFLNEPETEQVVFGKGQPRPPRGHVFVNAARGVMLMASNLPAAPTGKIYEMWLVPKSGAPIPAGLFQSDAQGNALYIYNQAINRSGTKAIGVTLEPERGSNTPTMPLVIAAGLSD